MSQHSECDSKIAESSHLQTMEYHSEADEPIAMTIEEGNELDHETMDSERKTCSMEFITLRPVNGNTHTSDSVTSETLTRLETI